MDNWKILVGVIIGTLVLVFGVAVLFSGEEEEQRVETALVAGQKRHVKGAVVEKSGEDLEASGAAVETPEGVVEIVEFSDFQCPACRAAHPVIEAVLERHGDKVVFIYRHFPLEEIHPNARAAAVFGEFAAGQGLFWPVHDLLFERQDEWAGSSDVSERFAGYIEELGGSSEGLGEALESEDLNALVDEDVTDGLRAGVSGTPGLFVDGKAVGTAGLLAEVEERL